MVHSCDSRSSALAPCVLCLDSCVLSLASYISSLPSRISNKNLAAFCINRTSPLLLAHEKKADHRPRIFCRLHRADIGFGAEASPLADFGLLGDVVRFLLPGILETRRTWDWRGAFSPQAKEALSLVDFGLGCRCDFDFSFIQNHSQMGLGLGMADIPV